MPITKEAKSLLVDCEQSTKFAAKALFPERFTRSFDPIHDEIFQLIDNSDAQRKAIAVPRGLGKTSIVNLLLPAVSILLQRKNYIVPVSLSKESAVEQTENLKAKLTSSPLIQELYGDIKGVEWSKEKWIAQVGSKEIMVRPRGAGTQIRGLLFRDSRPDLIVVDDLEDPDEMDSPARRKKKKSWFYADLMNSVDRGSNDWEIIVLGTVLHQDSLLNNLLNSPNWESVSLTIADEDFRSNAPNFMNDEQVKDLYKRYKADGEIDVFYREYMNNPNVTGEDAAFRPKDFKAYTREKDDELSFSPDVENIVVVDPSRTTNPGSNPTGIVGWGANMNTQRIYVRRCMSERLKPEDMYVQIARVIREINANALAIEVTGLHEFIMHPMRTFLMKQGISIPIIELQAREGRNEKGKTARVRGLVDFYRQGLIEHLEGECDELENQLLSFPNAKEWSLMDPFGYLPEILEKGERYLSPTPGLNEFNESRKDVEEEYEDLDYLYDEQPLTDFRVFE